MGLFNFLTRGLKKTRSNLVMQLDGFSGKITDDTLEELEEILVLADVGVATAGKIVRLLGERVQKKNLEAGQLREQLRDVITQILLPDEGLKLGGAPTVILVVGVNGVGKTTTIGKLAHYLQDQGHRVLLGAADTFRAAAAEQLEVWAQRSGCPLVKHQEGSDPAAVVFDSITAGKARGMDVVLCDTAGRLHNKKNLMDELSKIGRIVDREGDPAYKEVLLVLDATTGQNGLNQAKEFAHACGVTGVVLTKLDGTAKGGVVIAIRDQLGLPIKFVGVGEQLEDLRPFSAQDYANALLFDEE